MAGLMLQGTGSDVGKSILVAGLCRAASNRGLHVLPFKPQNMSNNAAVTPDGGEIGRAQALQALAARAPLHVDMNPVLLKPQADHTSQLIVLGQVRGTIGASNFREARRPLLNEVIASYRRLEARCDLVIIEGAGSPAEINLRAGDIANMGFARETNTPVILVGDIDRGGVIAAVAGTRAVIDLADAAMIQGFIINKFRGDPTLFADGYTAIEHLSGWHGYGVLPWVSAVSQLPSEDAVVLERGLGMQTDKALIACPILPRIANFDDLDPLRQEPGIEVAMVPPGTPIPAHASLIILPGSKATIADLAFLRAQGWDIDILAHHRQGKPILGICGGYQMLGQSIADPMGIEGPPSKAPGLGLLNVSTVLGSHKALSQIRGTAFGTHFEGYEMHMGTTEGPDTARPFSCIKDASNTVSLTTYPKTRNDGAISRNGLVFGTYCHGLLAKAGLRQALLNTIGSASDGRDHDERVDAALDDLANSMETHLNVTGLLALAGIKK